MIYVSEWVVGKDVVEGWERLRDWECCFVTRACRARPIELVRDTQQWAAAGRSLAGRLTYYRHVNTVRMQLMRLIWQHVVAKVKSLLYMVSLEMVATHFRAIHYIHSCA